MKNGVLRLETRRESVVATALKTETFWERSVGLLGRRRLPPGEGLLIERCNSVHTFFMRFAIDVVFLNRQNDVIKIEKKMKPFRLAMAPRARSVVELPAGEAERMGIHMGCRLLWEEQ